MFVPSEVHKLKNIDGLFTYFYISSPYPLNAEINQWCMKWSKTDGKSDTLTTTLKK